MSTKLTKKAIFEDMLERFLIDVQKYHPYLFEGTWLVAVSGGLDSMVLCNLLIHSNIQVHIAHVNFSLRGNESDGDEAFVKEFALKHQIPHSITSFDTKREATNLGLSTQETARKLRYDWFAELKTNLDLSGVVTAHHLSDSVETVLFNLSRGTGLEGVSGIKSSKEHICRPLLRFTRDEIHTYALQHQITWREDASNASTDYSRNFIRHKIIPSFKSLNPSFEQNMDANISRFSEAQQLLDALLKSAEIVSITHDSYKIDIAACISLPGSTYALWHLIKPFGFSWTDAVSIISSEKVSGKKWYSNEYRLSTDRTHWIIVPRISENNDPSISIDAFPFQIEINSTHVHLDYCPIPSSLNDGIIRIDAGACTFPLTIRRWKSGDKIKPLGMRGFKKVSDVLVDHKIPLHKKEQTIVLTNNVGEILFVSNTNTISEDAKISSQTVKAVSLHFSIIND